MCDTDSNVANAEGDSSGTETKNEPTWIAQQPEMLTKHADMGGGVISQCLGECFETKIKAEKRS